MSIPRFVRSETLVATWWLTIGLIAFAVSPENPSQSLLQTSEPVVALYAYSALLALWATSGEFSGIIRVFGLLAGAFPVVVGLSFFGEWPNYWYLLVTAATQMATLLGCGVLRQALRIIRAKLARLKSPNPVDSVPVPPRWSVRDMTLMIAVIAVFLTPLSQMRPLVLDFGQRLRFQVVIGLALAFVSLAAAWSASRGLFRPSGLFALLLCVGLATWAQYAIYRGVFSGLAILRWEYWHYFQLSGPSSGQPHPSVQMAIQSLDWMVG